MLGSLISCFFHSFKQPSLSMSPEVRQQSKVLSCHKLLHFGKCIESMCLHLGPPYLCFDTTSCPLSFLLPSPLCPPPISPSAPVFRQVETETRRGHLLLATRKGIRSRSPASLQQRILGIRPVVRSQETWTSSRSLLWRGRQTLERRERFWFVGLFLKISLLNFSH